MVALKEIRAVLLLCLMVCGINFKPFTCESCFLISSVIILSSLISCVFSSFLILSGILSLLISVILSFHHLKLSNFIGLISIVGRSSHSMYIDALLLFV